MKNTKTFFCAAPLPFLWYFNNFVAITAFLLMVLLVMILIIRTVRNKIKKKTLCDKTNKTFILWIGASVLFLVAFVFSFAFYPISLICLATILLIVFSIAKKLKLFKIRIIYLLITFILLFGSIVISGLKIKEIYFKPEILQINSQNLSNDGMPIGTIYNLSGCSGFSLY